MNHGGIFVHLRSPCSEQTLDLNFYPKGNRFYEEYANGSELDHLAFWVKDVDECFEHIQKIGGSPALGAWSEGGYIGAFVKDPDGIWIELLGLERKRKAKK